VHHDDLQQLAGRWWVGILMDEDFRELSATEQIDVLALPE
jgi:hypothetical protein